MEHFANPQNLTGNHDTTLDEPFFFSNENKWKWPQPQDTAACRRLLTESTSITYLENEAATIFLTSPKGPKTSLKIFGSPCSPGTRGWAFQYADETAAKQLWTKIEDDVDIVVTHTPAHGHCDTAFEGERAGCRVLSQHLASVRPMLQICGHIHHGRGVERIKWPLSTTSTVVHPVRSVESWNDPGAGNKKLSLVDLTQKGRHPIDNGGRATYHAKLDVLQDLLDKRPDVWNRRDGGAIEYRHSHDAGSTMANTEGISFRSSMDKGVRRNESVVINAAFLHQRMSGKAIEFNKPIVVDVELPVWEMAALY